MSSRAPLDAYGPVAVIDLTDPVPEMTEVLGHVKVGDTGLTTNCSYSTVIARAREAARQAGGNALQIIEHRPPTTFGSSCHRITAAILYVPQEFLVDLEHDSAPRPDSALLAEGCAVIHFYRFGGAGALVGYDIRFGDETVAQIQNNSRESMTIKALGEMTFWARTESRSEVTIPVEAGYHYYVRCGVDMGLLVGRPSLEWVDSRIGAPEFESVRERTRD